MIATRFVDEKALQPRGRDPLDQVGCTARRARDAHCSLVDVGAKDLHLGWRFQPIHVLAQKDRDRISLLARGTSDDPDTHLIIGVLALEQLWYDRGLERPKCRIIAKEIGDPNQQI